MKVHIDCDEVNFAEDDSLHPLFIWLAFEPFDCFLLGLIILNLHIFILCLNFLQPPPQSLDFLFFLFLDLLFLFLQLGQFLHLKIPFLNQTSKIVLLTSILFFLFLLLLVGFLSLIVLLLHFFQPFEFGFFIG